LAALPASLCQDWRHCQRWQRGQRFFGDAGEAILARLLAGGENSFQKGSFRVKVWSGLLVGGEGPGEARALDPSAGWGLFPQRAGKAFQFTI
jgi:hypothetical protein